MERREFIRRSMLTVVGAGVAASTLADGAAASTQSHCLWGAGVQPRGGESHETAIKRLENMVDRKLKILRCYEDWEDMAPTNYVRWAVNDGRIPYVQWHGRHAGGGYVSWGAIASGAFDDHIRAKADAIRRFDHRLFFGFHHEPERDPQSGSPAEFRAAWQRVRNIFDQVGTRNVTWVCALEASTLRGSHGGPGVWLPDGHYMVGVDGYNRGHCDSIHGWRSFKEIFGGAHTVAQQRGLNVFIGEFGCVEDTDCGGGGGDSKAQWLLQAAETIRSWPRVKAAVYTHAEGSFQGTTPDYWIDTSRSSLQAYRKVGLQPYFL